MPEPDLNTVCLTATLVKMPDYALPWTFCELKVVQPDGGVLFLAGHVSTAAALRVLEDLSPGDRLYVAGELAYSKTDHLATGGQHCLKVKELRRLDAAGRLQEASDPAPPPREAGDRKRRHRKRRAGQGRHG